MFKFFRRRKRADEELAIVNRELWARYLIVNAKAEKSRSEYYANKAKTEYMYRQAEARKASDE